MRSVHSLALTAAVVGVLASSASGAPVTGQLFYFTDPVPANTPVTATSAQFDTNVVGLARDFSHVAAADNHVFLTTQDFVAGGGVQSTSTTPFDVVYYLANYDTALTNADFDYSVTSNPLVYGSNDTFGGAGSAVVNSGLLTFVNPTTNDILLQVGFTQSGISTGGFGASEGDGPIYLGGSLLSGDITDFETGADFSFVFGGSLTNGARTYRSSTFTASLGNAPAAPVPEPATMAVLGLGALGVLRRKRRA